MTDLTRLIQEMREVAANHRRRAGVVCCLTNVSHVEQYERWADLLTSLASPPTESNEGMLFRRLSDALTGGRAGTWDEVIHAAETAAAPPLTTDVHDIVDGHDIVNMSPSVNMADAAELERQGASSPPSPERRESPERETRNPPCGGCGGPHPFDTTVPSVRWNAVIRAAGLADYLCLTCIVRAFVNAGESFTADLVGAEFSFVPIEIRVRSQEANDSYALSEENTTLRWRLRQLLGDAADEAEGMSGSLDSATSPTDERSVGAARTETAGTLPSQSSPNNNTFGRGSLPNTSNKAKPDVPHASDSSATHDQSSLESQLADARAEGLREAAAVAVRYTTGLEASNELRRMAGRVEATRRREPPRPPLRDR